jgi:hypothetical protein
MKLLLLSDGINYAVVDDEDYERLNQFTWTPDFYPSGKISGIRKHVRIEGVCCNIPLANEIMHNLEATFDHADRDAKNNQKYNLREANASTNGINREKFHNSVSKYKGVTWVGRDGKWSSRIRFQNKVHSLGYFLKEKDAALTYNKKALELFGDRAVLNEVPLE